MDGQDTKSRRTPIESRPWMFTDEVMAHFGVENYATFKQNYIDRGLKWWRMIGRVKFWLKEDLYRFVEEHGMPYDGYVAPKGRPRKDR